MLVFWLLLSIAIGALASRMNRSGFTWFFVSLITSPLIAGIFLLVIGPEQTTPDDTKIKNDKADEWETVKKFVPEVNNAFKFILSETKGKGAFQADRELKKLFFALGKEGLTQESLQIIIKEINEKQKMKEDKNYDVDVIETILHSKKQNIGYSPAIKFCEICQTAKTKQTINNFYVCSTCKTNYL